MVSSLLYTVLLWVNRLRNRRPLSTEYALYLEGGISAFSIAYSTAYRKYGSKQTDVPFQQNTFSVM